MPDRRELPPQLRPSGPFKDEGGFARLDKIFEGRLDALLGDLREVIWERAAG